MRHPFDGIIPANQRDSTSSSSKSRREALALIVGASAAPLAVQLAASTSHAQQAAAAGVQAEERPLGDHRLYFVVPDNVKAFTANRRGELKVQGNYLPGIDGNEKLKDKPGFLAWWNEEQAAAAGAGEDVATVHAIEPDDVAIAGAPGEKGKPTLRVFAAPFDWNAKPEADTYLDIAKLGAAWEKQFSMHEGVKVVANKAVRTPFVTFDEGKEPPKAVIDAIKSHPQVYALQWLTPTAPTTKRVGEEGGVTTEAVGEEGGVTTFAVGEEGGPTTLRIGEEGGVTTKALGEEGGRPRPSTRALGEEGGRPRPLPRPLPQPTTQALGEEGGRK